MEAVEKYTVWLNQYNYDEIEARTIKMTKDMAGVMRMAEIVIQELHKR